MFKGRKDDKNLLLILLDFLFLHSTLDLCSSRVNFWTKKSKNCKNWNSCYWIIYFFPLWSGCDGYHLTTYRLFEGLSIAAYYSALLFAPCFTFLFYFVVGNSFTNTTVLPNLLVWGPKQALMISMVATEREQYKWEGGCAYDGLLWQSTLIRVLCSRGLSKGREESSFGCDPGFTKTHPPCMDKVQ